MTAAAQDLPGLAFGVETPDGQRQLRLGDAALGADSFLAQTPVAWMQRQADVVVLAQTPANDIAGTFAALYGPAEPVNGPDSRKLALSVNATNRNPDAVSSVHAIYAEAVRDPGGAGTTGDAIALELQAVNRGAWNPVEAINPYQNIRARSYGLLLGSGGDVYGPVTPADSAVTIAANPALWNQGIVVRADALNQVTSPLTGQAAGRALDLGANQQITWWHNDGGATQGAALAGRAGGDLDAVAARDLTLRAGQGVRQQAGNFRSELTPAGLAVILTLDAGDRQVLGVTEETLIFDLDSLPRAPDAVPLGGLWLAEQDDGSGVLRVRLR